MPATDFLDNCYKGLSKFTSRLYFFPYTAAAIGIAGIQYSSRNGGADEVNPLVACEIALLTAGALGILSPILAPLTFVTACIALAIDIIAFLTKLVSYPIAKFVDSSLCCGPAV